jgi:hypothetical protein
MPLVACSSRKLCTEVRKVETAPILTSLGGLGHPPQLCELAGCQDCTVGKMLVEQHGGDSSSEDAASCHAQESHSELASTCATEMCL